MLTAVLRLEKLRDNFHETFPLLDVRHVTGLAELHPLRLLDLVEVRLHHKVGSLIVSSVDEQGLHFDVVDLIPNVP